MMKLLEHILLEDKIEFIANRMGDRIMQSLRKDAPNSNVTDPREAIRIMSKHTGMKYLQVVCNWYANHDFKIEDLGRIKRELDKFDKIKPHLEPKERDINQYKHSSDVYDIVQRFAASGENTESGKSKARQAKKGSEVYYKDNDLTVIIPKTEEAACYYGKGTRWCTSGEDDNAFDEYNERGPLYIIITKDNEKFQFHFESEQFMDAKDDSVELDDLTKSYPVLKKVFSKQAHKHVIPELMVNPSDEDLLLTVKHDEWNFRKYFEYKPENLKIKAIRINPHALRVAVDKTPGMAKAAVEKLAQAIYYVPSDLQTDEIIKLAINKDIHVINGIPNPTVELIMGAYKHFKERKPRPSQGMSSAKYWLTYVVGQIRNRDVKMEVSQLIRKELGSHEGVR